MPTAAWQAHESLELALLVVNFRGFAEVEVLNGGCRLEVVEGNDVLEGGVRFGLGLEPVLREVVVSSVS